MYEYKAKLIRVVDGDTIIAELDLGFNIFIKERIRFSGIDTPESRTRNKYEKSWGIGAKERVAELLSGNNTNFILTTELQKKGKFGRILGNIVLRNGRSVNSVLLTEKLAIPYEGGNKEESRLKYGVNELWETSYFDEIAHSRSVGHTYNPDHRN
jgi:micrococcal nuclease